MLSSKRYQIGGAHYRQTGIQPWDIIDANGLDFYMGSAIKYLLRTKSGVSRREDLLKMLHCVEKYLDGTDPDVPQEKACCALEIADLYGLSAAERELCAMLISDDQFIDLNRFRRLVWDVMEEAGRG